MPTTEQKKMYRCTRRAPYGPGCPGHTDPSARQGYYREGKNEEEALEKMRAQFPGEEFDIQLWKEDGPVLEALAKLEEAEND